MMRSDEPDPSPGERPLAQEPIEAGPEVTVGTDVPGRASPVVAERADGAPYWPFWHGLAAIFVAGFVIVFVLGPTVIVVQALTGASDERPPALTIGLTVLSDAVIVGTAVGLAALTARPRARHFGLRATPLWPAVGFSVLGILTYFVFGALYEAVYPDEVRQTTLETLGADRSTLALVAVGVLVVVLAPLTEELFFRGFLYRSLRTRLSIPLAALIAGGLFGSVHLSTGVAATLPLALLGVTFCLIVERTGSLYPVIALHALVNGVAYSASPDAPDGSAAVALPLLAAMLAGCLLLPRLGSGRDAPGPVDPAPAPG